MLRDFFESGIWIPVTFAVVAFICLLSFIYSVESNTFRLEYKTGAYSVNVNYTRLTTEEVEILSTRIQRDMMENLKR